MTLFLGLWAALGVAYWSAALGAAVLMARRVPGLSSLPAASSGPCPKVSILVPACDEQDSLAATLTRLLELDYPALELIVVDDRSRDETPRILDRLAAQDPRIQALHIQHLPDGWLGKLHALQRASERATGEWLVVMDADVEVAPSALRRLVAWAESGGIDYVTILPRFHRVSPLLDATVAAGFRMALSAERPWLASDARSSAVCGFGAFNLVRRSAFARTEGFEWLRLEVADDVGLALLMKRSGARCAVVHAGPDVALTFYTSVRDLTTKLQKNAFAIVGRFSLSRVVALVSLLALSELAPLAALLTVGHPVTRALGAAALVLAVVTCVRMSRLFGLGVLAGLLFPLAIILLSFVQLRGGWIGWRRGGVDWRGTFYPSAVLRAGTRVRYP